MNQNFDVVIVGAGTAGLILARELGKSKRKTLLLDRKKELLEFSFNTLASFIDLDKFDLTHNVVAQDIDTISFHSKRKCSGVFPCRFLAFISTPCSSK